MNALKNGAGFAPGLVGREYLGLDEDDQQKFADGRAIWLDMVQFFAIKIKDPVDLPDQMIRRHHLVEIERVKELTLSALSPPHHRPLPRITSRSTESLL